MVGGQPERFKARTGSARRRDSLGGGGHASCLRAAGAQLPDTTAGQPGAIEVADPALVDPPFVHVNATIQERKWGALRKFFAG
jgi:hypothetical protein